MSWYWVVALRARYQKSQQHWQHERKQKPRQPPKAFVSFRFDYTHHKSRQEIQKDKTYLTEQARVAAVSSAVSPPPQLLLFVDPPNTVDTTRRNDPHKPPQYQPFPESSHLHILHHNGIVEKPLPPRFPWSWQVLYNWSWQHDSTTQQLLGLVHPVPWLQCWWHHGLVSKSQGSSAIVRMEGLLPWLLAYHKSSWVVQANSCI